MSVGVFLLTLAGSGSALKTDSCISSKAPCQAGVDSRSSQSGVFHSFPWVLDQAFSVYCTDYQQGILDEQKLRPQLPKRSEGQMRFC